MKMNLPDDTQASVATATQVWPQMAVILTPPQTTEDFDRLVAFSHHIIDSGAGDEHHSLATLLDLAGILITDYEREHGLLWEQQP